MPPQAPDHLVPISRAAAEVGVHEATLYRYIAGGELQRFRIRGDRRTFVDREQLRRLLEPRAE